MEYLYKLFELFVRGTCLFSHIYSFSHFYQHGLMDIYVVAWVVIQCCVISRLKLLQVCPLGTLSRLLLNPFDISCLCYFYLFFEQCHFFWNWKIIPLYFVFSLPYSHPCIQKALVPFTGESYLVFHALAVFSVQKTVAQSGLTLDLDWQLKYSTIKWSHKGLGAWIQKIWYCRWGDCRWGSWPFRFDAEKYKSFFKLLNRNWAA